jgi:hypothetical protein
VATASRTDGRPAAGAQVDLLGPNDEVDSGEISATGTVRVGGLVPGRWTVTLRGRGVLGVRKAVTVEAGKESPVNLREPLGASLRVRVLDTAGRGLPFAVLSVRPSVGSGWWDVTKGVQRLDPYVDHGGARTIPRLPPGPTEIVATYGRRKGSATITLIDASVQEVTITLEEAASAWH